MANFEHFRNKINHSPFFTEAVFFFFPVSAIYAVLMPFSWVFFYQLSYPGTDFIAPQQWHAHEMIFGFYSAALAGFLCSAIAEWTNTKPIHGMKLFWIFVLWLPGRLIGFIGLDALMIPATLFDLSFLSLFLYHALMPMIKTRQSRSLSFVFWLIILVILEIVLKMSWWQENSELASRSLWAMIAVFVILFSLSLTRINTVVVNLALDPTGASSPYRPHPGRRNLAAFLTALYALAMFFLPNSQMQYYLAFAAAAGFFDRQAEWFIGKSAFKAEVFCLAMANFIAGIGFSLISLSGFTDHIAIYTGLHSLTMGTLGLAVMAVFTIAGLRHSGRDLIKMPWQSKAAIGLIILASLMRVLPEIDSVFAISDYSYVIAALLWSLAFLIWLFGYLPLLKHPIQNHH